MITRRKHSNIPLYMAVKRNKHGLCKNSLPLTFASRCPVIPAPFIEKTIFVLWLLLPLCQRSADYTFVGHFWSLYSVTTICLSLHSSTLPVTVALQWVLKLSSVNLPMFFFFNIMLAILGLLHLCVNFRTSFLTSIEKFVGFGSALFESMEKLTSWQYWVISMNVEIPSIYLVFPW